MISLRLSVETATANCCWVSKCYKIQSIQELMYALFSISCSNSYTANFDKQEHLRPSKQTLTILDKYNMA
jgi:hypothetical protein